MLQKDMFKLVVAIIENCHISSLHIEKNSSLTLKKRGKEVGEDGEYRWREGRSVEGSLAKPPSFIGEER